LLIEKFSVEEQASLIWQFICSIPVNMLAEFLPWLSSSISPVEYQDMLKCLSMIIPKEKLLQQASTFHPSFSPMLDILCTECVVD
jgi:zinc finger-like protein